MTHEAPGNWEHDMISKNQCDTTERRLGMNRSPNTRTPPGPHSAVSKCILQYTGPWDIIICSQYPRGGPPEADMWAPSKQA
ncbi:hypothetical protein N7535_003387 [Penicillium sp. DV-2018c]|nr:hypothetical protein N7535_003387 [Penicillium sp. DV-2018c]